MTYQSSVLRCHHGDDDCPVCRFLDGDRSEWVLMKVIECLDFQLHDSETYSRRWLKRLTEAVESAED